MSIKRRDVPSGVFLALAVSVKPFLGFVVLYFPWKRAYRGAAIMGIVSTALVLPALILRPQVLYDLLAVWSHFFRAWT